MLYIKQLLVAVLASTSVMAYAVDSNSQVANTSTVKSLDDLLKAQQQEIMDKEKAIKDKENEAKALQMSGMTPLPTGARDVYIPTGSTVMEEATVDDNPLDFVATGSYGIGKQFTLEGVSQGRLYTLTPGDTINDWKLLYVTLKGAIFSNGKKQKIVRVSYPAPEGVVSNSNLAPSTSKVAINGMPPSLIQR